MSGTNSPEDGKVTVAEVEKSGQGHPGVDSGTSFSSKEVTPRDDLGTRLDPGDQILSAYALPVCHQLYRGEVRRGGNVAECLFDPLSVSLKKIRENEKVSPSGGRDQACDQRSTPNLNNGPWFRQRIT